MGSKFSSGEELGEKKPKQKLWHEHRPVVVNTGSVLKNYRVWCQDLVIRTQDGSNWELTFRQYWIPHKRV